MSGFKPPPPLPIELTVGAGRLAALTLPSGVDELVMLVVVAEADMVVPGCKGRPGEGDATAGEETEGASCGKESSVNDSDSVDDGDVGHAGDARGELSSSDRVDAIFVIVVCS